MPGFAVHGRECAAYGRQRPLFESIFRATNVAFSAFQTGALHSDIDAINSSIVNSGDQALGVTLAFNTIGYKPQNTLFNALDALLKTEIGTKQPAKTFAKIDRSTITSAGDINVSANSAATVHSHLTNEATSAASALVDASGSAASFVLASNMVATDIDALITSTSTATNVTGQNVNILAVDNATIDATTKLLAASSTTNDAGVSLVNTLAGQLMNEYDYSSLSGSKSLAFGDKVRVASTHAASKGDQKAVYQYMGASSATPVDLSTEDFSNADLWKKLDIVNVLPPGLNVTDSDSMAIGGMVVRNDVLADVDASVTTTTIFADGNLNITATGSQTIHAQADATATSSGGSALGTGTSLAVNATIATNTILGGVRATATGSSLTTKADSAGDISITATNSAKIDADNRSALSTGDTGVSVHLAFNTIGYEAQNVLFQAIDTLVNTNIGTSKPVNATATAVNTTLTSDDAISVTATNSAVIESSLTNETISAASALMDASGMAVGVVLASNMVQSSASATIDYTSTTKGNVTSKGTITVEGRNRAAINANSQLDAQSSTTNDGGVSTAANWLSQFIDNQYDFTSLSGTQSLGAVDFQHLATKTGQTAIGYNTRVLKRATETGERDTLYRFVGITSGTTNIDLSAEDYTDTKRWHPVHRRSTTKVRVASTHTGTGVKGGIYRYIGTPGNVNLGSENYADTTRWERVTEQAADFIPNIGNITDSDSKGVGVLVVRNDSRSDVKATIARANLDGLTATSQTTNVTVQASEQADLRAITENRTESSGGSAFGDGTSLAVGTTVATNTLLSAASATVINSRIDASGNVTVDAENRAGVDATANTVVTAGDKAVGAMLAFNTLGYQSQNVLFNTIDALLQTNIGTKQPARVDAIVRDTPITAGGNVTVTADNDAALNATVSNAATSAASALFGASGAAASILVTSNMLATDANATVEFSEPATATNTPDGIITAGGDLKIDANDRAGIFANTKLVASSVTTNDAGVSVMKNVLKAADPSDYDHHSTDGSQNIKFGDTVRLASDHTAGGNAGSIYRFMGVDQNGVDLGEVDYSDVGFWHEVSATKYIPENINVDDSDSMAIGALFVRNDVQAEADALLKNTTANVVGHATVNALEDATIHANINSEAESSGGSSFGTGTSLAANVVFATNVVQSSAEARVDDSAITTTGTSKNINVTADNTAFISARTIALTSTGADAGTATIAYNTIGWEAQNILFQTIDTLLGTDGIGNQNPAKVAAMVEDSSLIATGAINVTADNDAHIRATLGNKTDSQATAFVDATGKAVGVALGSNLVSTDAEAKIVSTNTTKRTAQAGLGGITVEATDDAGIRANSKLQSISSTTNDGGLGLAYDALAQAAGVNFTDKSGSRAVKQYDVVLIDAVDYSTYDTPDTIQKHDRIKLEFDSLGGVAGDVFEYIHATALTGGVDLEAQNYGDTTRWRKVLAAPEEAYMFVGTPATLDLGTQDYTVLTNWVPMKLADPRNVIPGLSLSITDSDSAAFGGLFVRNDVRSDVDAFVHYVDADTPGTIKIHADLTGVIRAQTRSTVTSSGGSMFGEGMSVAVNAVVATNTILSSADAYATNSELKTTGSGDIHVTSDNTSEIKADIASNVESNGYGIGVTLAFNTIGWASQNVLFNTVDTIIGGVIGTKQPAATKAYIDNTVVESADDVLVSATSNAAIDARISNVNATVSVTPAGGSDTITVGATLTMNKVATAVEARIKNATTFVVNGDVTVTSDDSSRIISEVEASSLAVGAGTGSSSGISVGLALSRNEIDNDVVAKLESIGTSITAAQVTGGDVRVTTKKDATLNASVVSTAIAVSAAIGKSLAVSGGGALAFNDVLGSNDASIQSSYLATTQGGGKTGAVSVVADDTSEIDALVRSVNVAIAIGTKPVPAVALGMAVATNRIGWTGTTPAAKYNSDRTTKLTTLLTGDTVKVVDGPLLGRVYKYIGQTITDTSAEGIQLGSLNYHDRSAWEQQGLTADAARINAQVLNSTLTINNGSLTVDADSRSSINAQVIAASAAVAASAKVGVSVAAAGVFTSNVIRIDNSAQVIGSTVTADSVSVTSDDKAGIKAVAGAASVAASLAGKASVSVSIGLSLAFNEISGTTLANVTGGRVTTDTGAVNVSASSRGIPLFNFNLTDAATKLDDASDKAQDKGGTATDEGAQDAAADLIILNAIAAAFQTAGHKLADMETVATDWTYTTGDVDEDHADGHVNVTKGDRVRLNRGYDNGGIGGRVYEFIGATATRIDLAEENYTTATRWKLVTAPPKVTLLEKGKAWLLVAGDGTSYTLRIHDTVDDRIDVTRNNISVIAAAASAGLAIGGKAGIAVSGAGAVSINSILTKTNAQLVNTIVSSATAVTVNSVNSAAIDATTVAASIAAGAGGAAGIGASLGVAVAKNLVGFTADGTAGDAHVRSRISNSSVAATSGNLTLQSVSSQRIGATLFAGSVAIGLGGKAGVAVSGSGVYGENRIDMDVESSINGDGATGISASDVVLSATDQSLISAFAGAASVSAAFGGAAGVSVSVGAAIARNSISSTVQSYILNADNNVTATGKVSVTGVESASIQVMAMAASVAAGFAGVAGVAVSGAGADAANFISTSTHAHITGTSVNASSDVLVHATNSAQIESRVFAASVGIGVGGVAGPIGFHKEHQNE